MLMRMPSSREAATSPPLTAAVEERIFDERNLARLMLIPPSLPTGEQRQSWERANLTLDSGFTSFSVKCTAQADGEVPYGFDNDVMIALLQLYIGAGCPEDGRVETTLHELLKTCRLQDGSRSRELLIASLSRLQGARYEVGESWVFQAMPQSSTLSALRRARKLNLINSFEAVELLPEVGEMGEMPRHPNGKFTARAILRIHLGDLLIESLRSGYTVMLDSHRYYRLRSNVARLMYRALMAFRLEHEYLHGFGMPLVCQLSSTEWMVLLSIQSTRNLARDLKAAHDQLLQQGVFSELTLIRRGRETHYQYHLASAPDLTPEDQSRREHLYAALRASQIPAQNAVEFITLYGEKMVAQALVTLAPLLLGGQVQRPGGMMRDLLRFPEKYAQRTPPDAEQQAEALLEGRRTLQDLAALPEHQLLPSVSPTLTKTLQPGTSPASVLPSSSATDAHPNEVEPEPENPDSVLRTLTFLLTTYKFTENHAQRLKRLFEAGKITLNVVSSYGTASETERDAWLTGLETDKNHD